MKEIPVLTNSKKEFFQTKPKQNKVSSLFNDSNEEIIVLFQKKHTKHNPNSFRFSI